MNILAHNTNVRFNGIATALASASVGGLTSNILSVIFQKFVNNYNDLLFALVFFLRAIRTKKRIIIFSCSINGISISS